MVIASEPLADNVPNLPAWIAATSMRSEPTMFGWREDVNPQASIDCITDLYQQAGITNPLKEIACAEVYVPFSWVEPIWLEGSRRQGMEVIHERHHQP